MFERLDAGELFAGARKERQRRLHQRRAGGDGLLRVGVVGEDVHGLVKGRVAGLVFLDQPRAFTEAVEAGFRSQREVVPGAAGEADPDGLVPVSTTDNAGLDLKIHAAQGFLLAPPAGFFETPAGEIEEKTK